VLEPEGESAEPTPHGRIDAGHAVACTVTTDSQKQGYQMAQPSTVIPQLNSSGKKIGGRKPKK